MVDSEMNLPELIEADFDDTQFLVMYERLLLYDGIESHIALGLAKYMFSQVFNNVNIWREMLEELDLDT